MGKSRVSFPAVHTIGNKYGLSFSHLKVSIRVPRLFFNESRTYNHVLLKD